MNRSSECKKSAGHHERPRMLIVLFMWLQSQHTTPLPQKINDYWQKVNIHSAENESTVN